MPFQRKSLRPFFLVLALGLLTTAIAWSDQPERKVSKLADGVYEIEHPRLSGNTTVIIGARQVFVVDTGFLPSDAQQDIAQIRQWTDRPVSFVLNTHFHNDHNLGNRTYMEAFPALTIIAHVETKREMDLFGPGSAAREEKSYASVQRMLETGKTRDGTLLTEADKTEVKAYLAQQKEVIDELKKVKFQSVHSNF